VNTQQEERLHDLQERVVEEEQELRVAFEELEDAARRMVGLRHRFAAHALPYTTGAFLLGVWLGGRHR
jgi:hypothetical protein